MRTPLISVLIPMYNAGHGVRLTLESLHGQTRENFEVVIVDDGSQDDSVEIARHTYPEARIFHQPENLGITAALNAGLAHCRGVLIARIDCFDQAYPSRFDLQVRALKKHPDWAAVGGHVMLYEQDGRDLGISRYPLDPLEVVRELRRGHSSLPHSGAMIRKEALLAVGGYDPFFKATEDYDLWCRLSLVAPLANVDALVTRNLSAAEGLSFPGAIYAPYMELARLERRERADKGLEWKNAALRQRCLEQVWAIQSQPDTPRRRRAQRAAFHARRAGQLLRSGERKAALSEYLECISYNASHLRGWLGLLSAALLPHSLYRRLLDGYKRARSTALEREA